MAAERDAERQRRTNRRLRGLLVGTAVFLIVALIAGSLAVIQGNRAEAQRAKAERAERISTARELAAASRANLTVDPERSVLLAMAAVNTTRTVDGTVVPEAELALHEAVDGQRVAVTLPGFNSLDYSPDGDRLIAAQYAETGGIQRRRDPGHPDRRAARHASRARSIVWDEDWSRAADVAVTLDFDGVITQWDTSEGTVVRMIQVRGTRRMGRAQPGRHPGRREHARRRLQRLGPPDPPSRAVMEVERRPGARRDGVEPRQPKVGRKPAGY